MSAVLAIAGNTVRELVRGKLLYNLLLFAALFVAGSLLVAQLTVGNWMRIILDMGLGAIEISGVKRCVEPSICEVNVTPCSSTFVMRARWPRAVPPSRPPRSRLRRPPRCPPTCP